MESIKIENLSLDVHQGFWKKKKSILKQVSLKVPQGILFGLLGHNGSGKTSLMHVLTGLWRPSEGQVFLEGHDIQKESTRTKFLFGYLPERPYFYQHLLPGEFLNHLGTLASMAPERLKERIPEVLHLVGLEGSEKLTLSCFSKGMLQRIGFAQALLPDPPLLLLDEPMSGLDPEARDEMRKVMRGLRKLGKTVFFTSHLLSDIESLCDEVAVLDHGALALAPEMLNGQEGRAFEGRLWLGDKTFKEPPGFSFEKERRSVLVDIPDEASLDKALKWARKEGYAWASLQTKVRLKSAGSKVIAP